MKFVLVTSGFLTVATATAAFTPHDPICDAVEGYQFFAHSKTVMDNCAPANPERLKALTEISDWLQDFLLSIHPEKVVALANSKTQFWPSDPADCGAAEFDGVLQWLEDWEATFERFDDAKSMLLGQSDTDWLRCID